MRAILLAAGQGSRLRNSTQNLPKCLIKIGDASILEHQISTLKGYNITDIFLVVGTKGEVWNQGSYELIQGICEREGVEMILNFDNDTTQNSYSLLLAMKKIKSSHTLAIDGDLIFGEGVLSLACENPCQIAIISRRVNDLSELGTRVIEGEGKRVSGIGKDVIPSAPFWFIHSGLIKVSASYFQRFQEILSEEEYRQLDLSHPLKESCAEHKLYNLEMNQGWVNVNTPEDLKQARQLGGAG
jgi:choline kinase